MTNISLLEMGKLKRRSVREAIIEILSHEFPLSIKKIYNKIRKEYNLGVTYQAVFKTIKEMVSERILNEKNREYIINTGWITDLHNEIERIETIYFKMLGKEMPKSDSKVRDFIEDIGPKIKEYLNEDNGCIAGITGGAGIFYAVALWKYLIREGKNVNFVELNKINLFQKKHLKLDKKNFENKKIIIVDSAIHTGTVYRLVMSKMNSLKKKFKIKDIKFVVNSDSLGLADFSAKSE